MSSNNTPAKRPRSDSNGKPAKKQRLSSSNLVTAPNLHVYSQYIDAKEATVVDHIDEIDEEDIPNIILAATDDIDFYKQAIAELQEKLTYCKTQVGLCGQLLGQLIARNASRVDLKKLLSPQHNNKSNDTPRKKEKTPPVPLQPFSPINSALTDTSISSQLTPTSTQKRATVTPPNKTVTRSVSAAEKSNTPASHEKPKKTKSAVNTQMSSDTSSSEDEPQAPMEIEAAAKNRVAASKSLDNLFLTNNKVRNVTIETSTYTVAHEMKPRSLIFNPHRPDSFTTASFDGSVKFWKFNENYTGDKDIDDDEEPMIQTGIITGKHMKHSRPPADISWSKWEERLAILFPQAASDQKGTNCQLVLVEASRMPTVSGLFLNTRPHTKDPLTIRWISRNKLVSGGADHAICSWNVDYEAKSCETNVLHTNHSSSVAAIHVLGDYIYSGGYDKKLICWNMKTETEVQHLKLDEKITSITPCPAQEKIFLLSKMSHASQLAIFDSRTSKAEMTLSYKAGVRNSSYVTPSWESSGTWICCGSTEPLLNLWDLRYAEANFPAYSWKMHKSRIFKAEFVPQQNKILTLSSDHFLGCHSLAFD